MQWLNLYPTGKLLLLLSLSLLLFSQLPTNSCDLGNPASIQCNLPQTIQQPYFLTHLNLYSFGFGETMHLTVFLNLCNKF